MFSIKAGSGWVFFGSGASGFLLHRRWRQGASLPPACDEHWAWAPWPVHGGHEQALSRLASCVADTDARWRLRHLLADGDAHGGLRCMSDAQVLHEAARMLASGRLSMMRQVLSEEGRRRHAASAGAHASASSATPAPGPRAGPPAAPAVSTRTPPPPPVAAEREPFDHDAQAETLINAARRGSAFCEECAKARSALQPA